MKRRIIVDRILVAVSMFFSGAFLMPFSALAQKTPTTEGVFSTINGELNSATSGIQTTVSWAVGIIGLAYSAIALFKYLKGDRESSNELIKVFVGLAITAILEIVINKLFING